MHDIVIRHAYLRGDRMGLWDEAARTIWLDARLTRIERRCTLLHELLHARRGDVPCGDAVLDARQEARVEHESAVRLVAIDALVEALRWSQEPNEVADELGVDLDTLAVRMATLAAQERTRVDAVLSATAASA